MSGDYHIANHTQAQNDASVKILEEKAIEKRIKGESAAVYARNYYLQRSEMFKQRARENYARNKERAAARYRATRAERLLRECERRATDGANVRARQRARYSANPAPAIARANKRRAIRLRAQVGTDRQAYRAYVQSVRTAESIACHWCSQPVAKSERRIDHVIPLAKGGSDAVANLCCACRLCNARKADKLPIEWLSEVGQ